jgi:addiction module HigA family antidote
MKMAMKNPVHPGRIVKGSLEDLNLSVTDAAKALNVSRPTLSTLINEKAGISPEMAVRLSQVFGGSAESWVTQQAHYDLARVRRGKIKLKRLAMA